MDAEKTYDPTAASAAVSRRMSRDCVVLKFFDHHDLWHLTSAFGVFAVLLAMMLADEEIAEKKTLSPREDGREIITV